jgi:hypothetical protein
MVLNPEGSQFDPGGLVPRNIDRVCAATQAIPSFQKYDRHARFLQSFCRRQARDPASDNDYRFLFLSHFDSLLI